jgi:Xaa-Pro aminopeptidase
MRLLLYHGERFDPNFYYHAGIDIDHSFLISNGSKQMLLVSKMNESLARASFRGKVVVFDNAVKTLSQYVKGKRVLFDANSLNARMYVRLSKLCRLKDNSQGLLTARSVKTPEEVAAVKKAAGYTKEIFASLDFNKDRKSVV